MNKVCEKLTVFFEEPFWIGIFERSIKGKLSVCKVTFGAEPKSFEVYEFIQRNYYKLNFSPFVDDEKVEKKKINPKRAIRDAKKQVATDSKIGTKSQQALQLQHEQNKIQRKIKTKEQKEAEKERQFEIKKQKRQDKHRGR